MRSSTSLFNKIITVGARGSKLSQAQVWEVEQELKVHYPEISFNPTWVTTAGDNDRTTSLRTLEKTDFFTKEIDELQLNGAFRISIHSAKDLPEPLRKGLKIVALTKGLDSSDVLVYQELPFEARIATSSLRREHNIRAWRPDLRCVDIRGTIEERLSLLDSGQVDGVVMAEAALIRLELTHRQRLKIPGETAPLQGKLAIIVLETDIEMESLFYRINY